MPITGLSERRRLTRMFRVYLGEEMENADGERRPFPKETDYFRLSVVSPEAYPQALEALEVYGKTPKSLRIMLPMEVEAVDPHTGDELVLNHFMRAYGKGKGLRCKGTGHHAGESGMASSDDEPWVRRICQSLNMPLPERDPHTRRWRFPCMGLDCVKFLETVEVEEPDSRRPGQTRKVQRRAQGKDPDASCGPKMVLRFFLLHPERDPANREDYCRVLGSAEVATGSLNAFTDVPSGIDLVRPHSGGRTSVIPMTLFRQNTWTYRPIKQLHFTCAITADPREVARWAVKEIRDAFLTDEVLAEVERLRALRGEVGYDSVAELVPNRRLAPALAPGLPPPAPEDPATPGASNPVGGGDQDDRATEAPDEAIARFLAATDEGEEPTRFLEQNERDAIKTLVLYQLLTAEERNLAIDPDWKPGEASLFDPSVKVGKQPAPLRRLVSERVKALVDEYDEANGTTTRRFLNDLTVRHRSWIRATLLHRLQEDADEPQEGAEGGEGDAARITPQETPGATEGPGEAVPPDGLRRPPGRGRRGEGAQGKPL